MDKMLPAILVSAALALHSFMLMKLLGRRHAIHGSVVVASFILITIIVARAWDTAVFERLYQMSVNSAYCN
jgi:hypothetical protein